MPTNSTHPLPNRENSRLGFSSSILRLPIFLFLFFACEGCVPYLFHLGKEQARILLQRRNISEVLSDPEVSEKTKEKLREVEQIREFGIRKLALSEKGGFQSFVQLDRQAIGWHVSACHPLRFESYTWWFPIAGTVPYKGYFSLEKAKAEEQRLKEEGWDTRVRITAGYSTLGWFEDPLFSTQLYEDKGDLASIVLHEMAHATVYFPGDSLFNESYASFVEDEGADEFILSVGGEKLLAERKRSEEERKEYKEIMMSTAKILKEVYTQGGTDESLKKKKAEIIGNFKDQLSQQSWSKIDRKRLSEREWNNEDFVGMLRYNSGSNFFKKKFAEAGRDFSKFHEEMKKLKPLSVEERKELLKE
ncbi:aminopeptidase [Leptospira langatensis]|uniref:Aminopeptidase n=1 Tax=Leptospira langatensis TaxID=2484983 RepID=A0A5F1ZY53_9LEPT|nr:aminopeptidase [Leptospira langatensis]TGK00025.1 aminopeptidase [Leptospira langatensis]TGL42660.1 aminopeptidase [Leptospira langatensis]